MEPSINSKKEFNQLTPEQKLLAEDAIRTELQAAYESKDLANIQAAEEKVTWLAKESQEDIMNATKARNRAAITELISNRMKDKGSIPTVIEIANELKISKVTVYSHLNEMRTQGFSDDCMLVFSSQKEKYLAALSTAAAKGDLRASKMAIDFINDHLSKIPKEAPKE